MTEEKSKPSKKTERLSHIDFLANFLGEVRRTELMKRFGISQAAATRDLKDYQELAPDNIKIDDISKTYVRSPTFKAKFEFPVAQVLKALSTGYGDEHAAPRTAMIDCEAMPKLMLPDPEILSAVSRAIHMQKVLKVEYHSMSSGGGSREIIPFAIADSGLRWHVRGFDRFRGGFRDFVLTRFAQAEIANSNHIEPEELPKNDHQWNRMVDLELIPHPKNVKHPRGIELDYGMKNGMLKIRVRAALAWYFLLFWNVDCSPNMEESINNPKFQLWLQNSQTLYGVEGKEEIEGLCLVPGYKKASSTS
ncbi:MAG: WYL domain-containing protein [bacterium]|nr:WYL domain-containing protein [bacterium]